MAGSTMRVSIDDASPQEWDDTNHRLQSKERGAAIAPVQEHPLYAVLVAAIEQAMHGKGVRHGGAVTPFLDQPWVHYARMHGRGFLTGQAAKKLEEAASTRTGEAFEAEVMGAIVYLGMAILHERQNMKEQPK